MAVTGFGDHRSDVAGGEEALESVCDGGVQTADLRQPRREQRLEEVELAHGLGGLEEPLARFERRPPPQVAEGSVTAGQLVGGCAEEMGRGPGPKNGSDDAGGPRRVAEVERRPRATDNGVAH